MIRKTFESVIVKYLAVRDWSPWLVIVVPECIFFYLLLWTDMSVRGAWNVSLFMFLSLGIFYVGAYKKLLNMYFGIDIDLYLLLMEQGVLICSQCGFPVNVTQEVNEDTNIIETTVTCGMCGYSSQIAISGDLKTPYSG